MAEYLVSWGMNIEADTPEAAGREALHRILDSHDGGCHVFVVEEPASGSRHSVDLGDDIWREKGEAIVVRLDPRS